MPTPIPTPINANPTAGLPGTALSTSGNVSGNEFIDVVFITQTLNGSWVRKWEYGSEPTGLSACPPIENTYCDIQATVTTVKEVRTIGVSGSVQQRQDVDYYSDSVSGGWGVSGGFWTSVAGITTRKALPTDTSAVCTVTYPAVANVTQGDYEQDLDTSGNFNGEFLQNVILPAVRECPEFVSVIVDI
jgi:hypothetical protein